jgi:carbon-monoxide dehydrogenase large subunit
VRVNAVGTIEVLTGSHSHGQGHETTFAQLVAERFGVPIDSVSIVHGDTDKVQMGMGTYGSRSGAVGMSAIVKALDKVEAKAKKIAAHLMEADESDIVIENGALKVAGTDKTVPWFQMALAAYTAHNLPAGMEPGLKEGAFYDPANFTFPAGCYICGGRGRSGDRQDEDHPVRRRRRLRQHHQPDDRRGPGARRHRAGRRPGDAGRHAHYDPETGQLLTASYMDYTMPRADDLPSFNVSHQNTPCPNNPLGIKGCGEAGAIGSPPALINAITDAIGNNDLSMPATPQKVWAAARAAAN